MAVCLQLPAMWLQLPGSRLLLGLMEPLQVFPRVLAVWRSDPVAPEALNLWGTVKRTSPSQQPQGSRGSQPSAPVPGNPWTL